MHFEEYRVYYEDTDAQGFVYYANYLKFFERARTEYLRSLGYEQKNLMEKGIIFVVRKVIVKYLLPANLDELIKIESKLVGVKKVSFNFLQTMTVKVVSISPMLLTFLCIFRSNNSNDQSQNEHNKSQLGS